VSDSRDLVERFASLFEGRRDAYGADHGECIRLNEAEHGFQHLVWNGLWKNHLSGDQPIGVYPIVSYLVKWGCSDIDVDDLQAAVNLRNALKALDITAWIEVSKAKGYHVWVFAEQWISAAIMRRALLAAHDIAGVPATEVNPKQERLAPNAFGNYVRLPYPGGLQAQWNDGRRLVIDPDLNNVAMPLTVFLDVADFHRTSQAVLQAAADLYVPPPEPEKISVKPVGFRGRLDAQTRLNGLAWTIYCDGPLEGGDRSGTLFKLAVAAFDSGLDPNEVYTIVEDADARWGKFSERRDGAQQLERIVARAASA